VRTTLRGVAALVSVAVLLTACGNGSRPVVTGVVTDTVVASSRGSQAASACTDTPTGGTSTVMIDWIDFVRLDGIEYIADLEGRAPDVPATRLGPVVGRVTCQLSVLRFSQPPGPAVDGDAAFLPVGTEVHAIPGVAPTCRVAAKVDGSVRVYLAHGEVNGVSRPVTCATAS
jgi:hypothetical protein